MQVVTRALSVLSLLAGESRGLAMGEVAERLSMPTASTHRILGVLEQERFVTRSPTNRRYFLGPAARELAGSDLTRASALVTPHRAVTEAGRRTGETVFVSEFVGSSAVCLALAESRHPLRLFVRVGQEMPLHAAAAARVLLAGLPETQSRFLLEHAGPFTSFTADTPSTVDEVLTHLEVVRRRGYDICDSELDDDVWAVSAPVRSSTEQVVASVTMAAPRHRVGEDQIRRSATRVVLDAARDMASDLGWVDPTG